MSKINEWQPMETAPINVPIILNVPGSLWGVVGVLNEFSVKRFYTENRALGWMPMPEIKREVKKS